MPRTYIRKRAPPSYTVDDVTKAVNDVLNGNSTYLEAAEEHGVPKTVIFNRIKGRKTDIDKLGAGRPTDLPREVEETLVQCLIARAQMGYPCDKAELKGLVQEYIKATGISTRFVDGKPGEDWYQAFMHRNPKISLKKPEHLQKARKKARDPFVVYAFFNSLKSLYDENRVRDVTACLVFNADESGFPSDPSRLRAIGARGQALSRVSDGSGRESTSVLACVAANGDCLPPLIVFKGLSVQPRWVLDKQYPGTMYAATSNGWMEEASFFQWFSTMFIPHIEETREMNELDDETAVLLYDGHASHMSVRIIELAIQKNVQLVKFPSHLTDRLQPLDKTVFGPLKQAWEKVLVEHGKTQMGKGPSRLKKDQFAELLGKVWLSISAQNVRSGFTSTGLFPLNQDKIPKDLFDPEDLERFKKRQKIAEETREKINNPSLALPVESENPREIPYFSGEIFPTVDCDDFNAVSVLDLSMKKRDDDLNEASGSSKPKTVDLIDIFSKSITRNTAASTSTVSPIKKGGTRLKHHTYGEVLTSEDVLKRLKEAEQKKETAKKATKGTAKKSKVPVKKVNVPGKRRQKQEVTNSETEDEAEIGEVINYDDDSNDDLDGYLEHIENSLLEDVTYLEPTATKITPSMFVLVDITGGSRKTTHFSYACRVDAVAAEELEVTGLKSTNGCKSKFALIENDKFVISIEQVKAVLPTPSLIKEGRKELYDFSGRVSVVEK